MSILKNYDGFILDLDGVIYLGNKLIPHSKKYVQRINQLGIKYVFVTNDCRLSALQYSQKLRNFGIPCTKEQVITPLSVLLDKLTNKSPRKTPGVLAFTSKKVRRDLKRNKDIKILNPENDYKSAQIVLVAGSQDFNYMDLMYACLGIQHGATFYTTSKDYTFPSNYGYLVPGTGAIVAAIEKATGANAINLGKPSKTIFDIAVKFLGLKRSKILMIGDNLQTDIYGSKLSRIDSALVLTGKNHIKDLKNVRFKPKFILKNLKEAFDSKNS